MQVVRGVVSFRPASHEPQEEFVLGNDAGIFPWTNGFHDVEFYYLRYVPPSDSTAADNQQKKPPKSKAVSDVAPQDKGDAGASFARDHYQVMERFPSDVVSIVTFNVSGAVYADKATVAQHESLGVEFRLRGLPYSVLSNPKARSMIAFLRAGNSSSNSSHATKNTDDFHSLVDIPRPRSSRRRTRSPSPAA
ncbi:hypothetical protein PINS_up015219 [Pythium insidiosum]|nr:hypothetical protein PINS_up015219 [Pythium insidiosum]